MQVGGCADMIGRETTEFDRVHLQEGLRRRCDRAQRECAPRFIAWR
jgi:hypothetical protein